MDFKDVRHFAKNENWGDLEKVNPLLVLKLDNFREFLGSKVILTSVTDGVHSTNSQHYKGNAADIIAPASGLHLLDQYIIAEKCGFTGIGVYPDWQFRGHKCGGLHVDVRPVDTVLRPEKWHSGPRWIGLKSSTGKMEYLPLTYGNLKRTLDL